MVDLSFKGKNLVYCHHLAVDHHELIPNKKLSLTNNMSLHDNLLIHGDSLKALKALRPTHAGMVQCIYIDPPYNTGNEGWVYNDNVKNPMMQTWIGKVVDKDDLTRHDKWLCMMWPRLRLMHEMLSEDGVIFISIDDNEVHHLRIIMDEIFGEDNFLYQLAVVDKLNGNDNSSGMMETQEYCMIYAKNKKFFKMGALNINEDEFDDWQQDDLGYYKLGGSLKATGISSTRESRPNLYFPIYIDEENLTFSLSKDNNHSFELLPKTDSFELRWYWQKSKFIQDKNEVIIKKTKTGYALYKKQRPSIGELPNKRGKTTFYNPAYSTANSSKLIKDLFNGQKIFEYTKSVDLIYDLLSLGSKPDSIILDCTAGSGTTAHAVMKLNKSDGGNRKFVLIQIPEEIKPESVAAKAGFNQVIDITRERILRVIQGVPEAKDPDLQIGYGGSFSYFEVGKALYMEEILSGGFLPSFTEISKYIFFTATGEVLQTDKMLEPQFYVGESEKYLVYIYYKPDLNWLKNTAFNLPKAEALGAYNGKTRLVFAPTAYLDDEYLMKHRIEFQQLPYLIYSLSQK